MTDIDAALLVAYVDGELDPDQRAQVETLLADNPDARAMVQRLRGSAELLRSGLDPVLDLPVPQRLIEAVNARSTETGIAATRIVELQRRTTSTKASPLPRLAIAASVLLGTGIITAVLLLNAPAPSEVVARFDPLQDALDKLPSGARMHAGEGAWIMPVLTLLAGDGRPCREFERQTPEGGSLGIACRTADARWMVQIEVPGVAMPSADQEGSADYSPASGTTDPLLDVLDRLGAGAALPAEEERRLLESRWQN